MTRPYQAAIEVSAGKVSAGEATTGVLGGSWRAGVTAWGAVRPRHGVELDWHVAADDRWHSPRIEAAVRQRRLDGTPVIETRLRIPGGDAVQRVWSVPDAGGLTMIEVANDSPLPIAVAFSRRDLLSTRPPTETGIEGIDLTPDAVAFPIGHHAAVTVAVAHDGRGPCPLPSGLPAAEQVVRGWLRLCERAGRVVLPDDSITEDLVAARSELALAGPGDPGDPVAFLLGVDQLVRLGEPPDQWGPEVATAAESVVRTAAGLGRRSVRRTLRATPRTALPWAAAAALDAAARLAHAADDSRALRDLAAARLRLRRSAPRGDERAGPVGGGDDGAVQLSASPVLRVAATERRLADADGRLLAAGLPSPWLGGVVEVHDLPIGLGATVSYALRWHGARPAVLWEVALDGRREHGAITLTSPVLAPGWSTNHTSGEALWPVPAQASGVTTSSSGPAIAAPDGDVSFG